MKTARGTPANAAYEAGRAYERRRICTQLDEILADDKVTSELNKWRVLGCALIGSVLVMAGVIAGRGTAPAAERPMSYTHTIRFGGSAAHMPPLPAPGPTPEVEPIGDTLTP